MNNNKPPIETITDFITGRSLPNEGAEANRQIVEKYLVEQKSFHKDDIHVNFPISVTIGEKIYRSRVDLAIHINGRIAMAIKCAAGSLGSRQREILAAARLLADYQIPLSIVTNGKTALVFDTVTGKEMGSSEEIGTAKESGNGMDAFPDRQKAKEMVEKTNFTPYPEDRREREAIIFRSYDTMNVNITRNN